MGKLVVLKFTDGCFERGFLVTLQIGEEGKLPSSEISGKLPAAGELPLYYSHWQSSYLRLGNCYRLSADKMQVTNVSFTQDCENAAKVLQARFNAWLLSEEFRPIREKWLEKLLPTDEVRVILQTQNSLLQRLPWQRWDLMERYPYAEIGLASPIYERIPYVKKHSKNVNILAILGNSQGIDTQADQALLQQLPNADLLFLTQPQRQTLTDQLWRKKWDILFFAGHSSSQSNNDTGRIYLNETDSLTIDELKYALKKAVERGLELAIFNSCDGLGLARALADLQIPQIIVMREPVPDIVAQEFLTYFLQGFASGEPFYQTVRHARERLQGLEDRFPCATWLPLIYQNLAQVPSTWQEITGNKELQSPEALSLRPSARSQLVRVLCFSVMITALMCGLRFLGLLQASELQAFDQMMRSRLIIKDEGPDPRLLVVTIDDADLAQQRQNGESLNRSSLSDQSLNRLLEKLQRYQPLAIGLDIYREFPAEPQSLIYRLKQTDNLIGVCKGGYEAINNNGTEPPPEISQDRLGFSDFITDSDGRDPSGVMRRHLLFMNQEATSLCPASYAFSVQLAFQYLATTQGIQPKFTDDGDLQIGSTVFHRLLPRVGGYQGIDANGGQILLNYRSSKNIAEQVTLTQLLSDQVNPNVVKNRIVLIGVTAKGDFRDYWSTPYGTHLAQQLPGILIHAHMTSQILSAVLDGRPLLSTWSPRVEIFWIWGWSMLGGVLVWQSRSLIGLTLAVSLACGTLYLLSFNLLLQGTWVPFVPSAMALVATVGVSSIRQK
jgi:CHASE2 domain-containing sensor protein